MAQRTRADFLVMILGPILKAVTPTIRAFLDELLNSLEEKAAETPNELDDIFVKLLRDLLGFDE